MNLSMYQVAVTAAVRMLNNLSAVLDKGAAHAEARKIDPTVLLNTRLYPDMFPLVRQVQIACDSAKFGAARLWSGEAPKFPDTETSFPELKDRIAKTVAFLTSLKPAEIDGTDTKTITFKSGQRELTFTGTDYILNFSRPNLYFHLVTAYAILRHCGVEVGKNDYLGNS